MLRVNVEDNFMEVAAVLAKAGETVTFATEAELAKIGEEVAMKAQENIDSVTRKIHVWWHAVSPDTVEVSGTSEGPLSRLLELGSKKTQRSGRIVYRGRAAGGTFRHPVYARSDDRATWTWVEQDMHPYLRPAWVIVRRGVRKSLEDRQGEALQAAGFDRVK